MADVLIDRRADGIETGPPHKGEKMDFNLPDEISQKLIDAPRQWFGRHVLEIAARLGMEVGGKA